MKKIIESKIENREGNFLSPERFILIKKNMRFLFHKRIMMNDDLFKNCNHLCMLHKSYFTYFRDVHAEMSFSFAIIGILICFKCN